MKYVTLLLLPLLFACSENYRYPCQDPDNWDKKECKKPYCSANGTCPEDLTPYEKEFTVPNTQTQALPKTTPQVPSKGECK